MANVIINDTNLTNIANAIREKNGLTDTYKPSEMAGAILAIQAGSGGDSEVEPIVLTGDCEYACTGVLAGAYIDSFGNTISTDAITKMRYMFYKSTAKSIPFVINGNTGNSDLDSMFCQSNIESLPVIKNMSVMKTYRWCQSAFYLREISDEVAADWNWSPHLTTTSSSYASGAMFQNCYSLRRIPNNILSNMRNLHTTSSYSAYNNAFSNCSALDEVSDLGVSEATYTSNVFSGAFSKCTHLKKFTFAVQEDGTPYVRTWKNQTIDLSNNLGYVNGVTNYITGYNSGLTEATQVKANTSMTEDERLAIIEQYPDDWWTTLPSWSRYTHASAVETINSLPDCSSGSGNTIKFYGASGTSHPEGAISTLTEEEIAVATAKGWTVTLV